MSTVKLGSAPKFKSGLQSNEDPFTFVLSDETRDRQGDIIKASAWDLDDFEKNPVALLGHDHEKVIGRWKNVRVIGKRLIGTLELAKEGTSELIDTTRKLVQQKILKAVSVGFLPLEGKPLDEKDKFAGYEFTKATLHEVSLVAVPANPQALSLVKSFSSEEVAKQLLFVESDSQPEPAHGRATTTPPRKLNRARLRLVARGLM